MSCRHRGSTPRGTKAPYTREVDRRLRLLLIAVLLLPATALLASTDVSITLTAPKFAPIGGSTSVQVNLGVTGGSATDVTFLYVMPSGMTFKSLGSASSFSCSVPSTNSNGPISCHVNALAPGTPLQQVINLNVSASASASTTFTHQAGVTTATPDPNGANDQASVTQTAQTAPSVTLTSTFPTIFVAGSPITYNITVHNSGGILQNVTFEDRVLTPNNGGYYTIAAKQTGGNGFTCSAVAPPVTVVPCSATSFAASGTSIITVTMETNPLVYASSVEHKTTVTLGDWGSIFTLDQTAQGTQSSDVAVTGSAPATVVVNGDLDFTVTARELGPSASDTITFTFTLPANTNFRGLTKSGNVSPAIACSTPGIGGGGTITCTAKDLKPAVAALGQAEVTAGFVVRLRVPNTPGSVTSTVNVAAPHDTSNANNTASATTTIITAPTADLSATLQSSSASAVIGNSVTLTARVANAGPVTAQNVRTTLTLPAGTSVATLPDGCTNSSSVVCTLATLASGASQTYEIPLTLTTTGSKEVSVTVASDTLDPDSSNNSAGITIVALPRTSDLAVTVGTSKTNVIVGDTFTHQVVVTASGPDTVSALLTGRFAASLQPTSVDSRCNVDGTTLTCAASMAANASTTYNFTFKATEATTYLTTFTVSTADFDPTPANNVGTGVVVSDLPATSSDVSVFGQVPLVAQTNSIATYVLTVSNRGPADASHVVLTFTPPPSSTIDTLTVPSSMTCEQSNVLTCTAATMVSGASSNLAVNVRMGAAGGTQSVATARVTSDNPEPDPSNNEVALTTHLSGGPFGFYVDPASISAVQGYPIAWTIRVLNAGVTALGSIDVTDALPSGMTLVSVEPSAGTCSGTSTVICHADTLPAPGLLTIRVVVMPPPPPGPYVSHISATSGASSGSADVRVTVTATSRHHIAGH